MIDYGIDEGWNCREERNALEISQDSHEFIDLETRYQDLGGTVEHAPVQYNDSTVNMEKRQNGHDIAIFRRCQICKRRTP